MALPPPAGFDDFVQEPQFKFLKMRIVRQKRSLGLIYVKRTGGNRAARASGAAQRRASRCCPAMTVNEVRSLTLRTTGVAHLPR
jgi:hypothetical protein